jgi:phosphoglycolate phosphatase
MKHLFFDLDGTLMDARAGIVNCIRHALDTLGEPQPDAQTLSGCLGPPLWDSFGTLLRQPSRERIAAAIAAYRDRFARVGMYENSIYPGIVSCLRALVERRLDLFVVTSKPQPFAQKVTDHFRLSSYFRRIHGPDPDESSTKATLIARVLESEALEPQDVMMIGDREHDILGARSNNVFSVGVCWGYGTREELSSAGADLLVDSPADLPDAIRTAAR